MVGIGSSAGGLEAIREFTKALPADINAAFIVAQHMAPKYRSHMVSLVASETSLTVLDVEDGVVPQAGRVYITPPNHDVTFSNGALQLHAPNMLAGAPKPSVDRLLTSLAEHAGSRAIGIILSGTGTDGAYGIQAIRERVGITLSQDDSSAKYDGMPNAAIETGCVDLVLSPTEMGLHLARILESRDHMDTLRNDDNAETDALAELLQIVFVRTGVDFREYKPATVHRRIERRMVALNIPSKEEYTELCRSKPAEVDILYKDLLISVTYFFRDKDEFQAIEKVIRQVVDDAVGEPVRVWTAGCATGEETYSIAILLAEAVGGIEHLANRNIQIFATDLDEQALVAARAGKYRVAALQDVPESYVQKYFKPNGEFVDVDPRLRSRILFTKHNICSDPPFLKLDLAVCRNLLIYLKPQMQAKVFTRLNYALNPEGVLFLGRSETATSSDDLFTPIERQGRIFRKKAPSSHVIGHSPLSTQSFAPYAPKKKPGAALDVKASQTLQRQLGNLEVAVGPVSLRVGLDHRILKVNGTWSDFIEIGEGTHPQLSTRMLKAPLNQEAFSLVTLSSKYGEKRRGLLHRDFEESGQNLQFTAYPVVGTDEEPFVLLVLEKWPAEPVPEPSDFEHVSADDTVLNDVIKSLQAELDGTRETLQQVIEELETSNEELQTLNEELQSANEELQATNEELETANEELQSTNEELITVNEELNVNAEELQNVNSEMESVFLAFGGGFGCGRCRAAIAPDQCGCLRHVDLVGHPPRHAPVATALPQRVS